MSYAGFYSFGALGSLQFSLVHSLEQQFSVSDIKRAMLRILLYYNITTRNSGFRLCHVKPKPRALSIYVEKPVTIFLQMEQWVWKKQLFRCPRWNQMERFFPLVILGNKRVSQQGAWYASVTEANGSVIFRSFR